MDRLTFEDFYSVRWHVAERTYGNDHSTLIGLLVDWWVSRDATNSVLEGGPSCNPRRTGLMGRGHCDALFCRNAKPVGVLEVEGCGNPKAGDVEKKAIETAKKLGRFFASADDNYSQLK